MTPQAERQLAGHGHLPDTACPPLPSNSFLSCCHSTLPLARQGPEDAVYTNTILEARPLGGLPVTSQVVRSRSVHLSGRWPKGRAQQPGPRQRRARAERDPREGQGSDHKQNSSSFHPVATFRSPRCSVPAPLSMFLS